MSSLFMSLLKDTSVPKESKQETKAEEVDAYFSLQKPAVLQEARCFNDKQINPKKCRLLIARLVFLLNQGEKFLGDESTLLFFSITKLFQSENAELRRMIYLIIREMQKEPSLYIITQSLTKDMSSKVDLFRMNSLRLAPVIIEPQYLVQSERYIKNAIIDKNNAIACAALAASFHLYPTSSDFVKKWSNEIMDKLSSKSPACHFHALLVLRLIKSQDKNSFVKLLVNLAKENNSNGIAAVQIIRFIREAILTMEIDESSERIFIDYLFKQSKKNTEIIVFEASKTLCEIKSLPNKELAPVISVLSLFLSSSNSVNKFAALKILNKLISNPSRVSLLSNVSDIETLIKDNNKSLSSLAMSILLKISKEENVESLLTQIQEFLSEISDEFRVDIVRCIRGLVRKHPKKSKAAVNFLYQSLKSEGNIDFKSSIVETMDGIMSDIPEAKEIALLSLAEYIEDCQHPSLHIQIMNLLAREAENINHPFKMIRFINNRIVLENSEIRAAAVTTLGKFALSKPELIPSIRPILENTINDTDVEVRGRTSFYIDEIQKITRAESKSASLAHKTVSLEELDLIEIYLRDNLDTIQRSSDRSLLDIASVTKYVKENNITLTVTDDARKKKQQQKQQKESLIAIEEHIAKEKKHTDTPLYQQYKVLIENDDYLSTLGELRWVSEQQVISDPHEQAVKLRKILFDEFITLEFAVRNFMQDHLFREVTIELPLESENLKKSHIITVNEIKYNQTGNVYITFAKHPESRIVPAHSQAFLKYRVAELSGSTVKNEYDDDMQLEDVEITVKDFLQPHVLYLDKKFDVYFKEFKGYEDDGSFQLEYKTLETAIKGLIKHFGMSVVENSDNLNMENKFHSLFLSGKFLGYLEILIICKIGFDPKMGCVMKMQVKSQDQTVNQNILETISQERETN